ncbi:MULTISPECIES: Gfo/Idh/MocA family oxidoreductase [unclassified Arcicella]|uniref:Gfo/Idh/MocA family protein n=1 Tax=unclassified Arcicella TaxID=2644986 RepID=UPI0028633BEB|nr:MULTISPECIES: Gfo/Idh/MocA family oxidoreductase [unclassified Arcicella]MDR6563439.1 putative dehydrogenase [Arcicella sp. BE51]MDR6813449.1 putative dehydrogenase [Arcicella sp. BE140]MDR6824762.1 putative dehydrogenase [Arcicella sp. BE139]
MSHSRRDFIRKISGSSVLLIGGTALGDAYGKTFTLESNAKISANDTVRIALIGSGIIGHYDTDTALKVPGVELVAVCDLYTGRLERAKEKWGKDIFTTKDYREILNRKDIDAVLVCTSDHWHDKISIDAMNAGKHVYCEKPMVHHIEEGKSVIEAQKKTGKVFQVGSQVASSTVTAEAKKIYESGIIGELVYVEATNDRTSANGAWQYTIPTDASTQTVDWDTYVGDAPKMPFDAKRFFRWRNYKDYGTGVAGDLFVHLLTNLHTITGSTGPNKIFALGDLNLWKDGRDAYDIVTALMNYPATSTNPSFQFFTRVNLADGGSGGSPTRLIGTEGVIELSWSGMKVKNFKRPKAPEIGGYDSLFTFSQAEQEESKKAYKALYTDEDTKWQYGKEITFKAVDGYDSRLDHFINFFESVRTGKAVWEDATFGLRAAAPALACNKSAEIGKPVIWNPETMKLG